LIAMVKHVAHYQAQLTFAMSRHAAVDLVLVFHVPPRDSESERLSAESLARLRTELETAGIELYDEATANATLAELRAMYEPFLMALGRYFLFNVPPIFPDHETVDNWQTSAWMRRTVGIGELRSKTAPRDDHFA
jgi:hypothetical protein